MTALEVLVGALIVLLVFEILLGWLLSRARRQFQWLITRSDIAPEISDQAIRQHLGAGFDPELGWVRKPGTQGRDQTANGIAEFTIDEHGCRYSPGFDTAGRVAVFGDSFAFCRLVNDHETWPHQLSQALGAAVMNFGVGNYGFDQACLRLERELPRLRCDVFIMGVVPETMSRIHSYWKHYFEYGNVLAFKPRFVLDGARLHLEPSAIRTEDDYKNYRQQLDRIQKLDIFYRSKFCADLLTRPYLLTLALRARKYLPILWHLAVGWLSGAVSERRRRALDVIFRENAQATARLYADPDARALFTAIARRFRDVVRSANAKPLLVIIPQPHDLDRLDQGIDDYRSFIRELSATVPTLDLTDLFLREKARHRLFVEGPLGPHVSPEGNRRISDVVSRTVGPLLSGNGQRNLDDGLTAAKVS